MSCPGERVTGYVDGALEAAERAEIEAHLADCESCRDQADGERALRGRLLGLLHPALPAGLEERVRARMAARPRVRPLRLLLPLAAAAALLVGWARQQPGVVAWEMARDHAHCFAKKPLPAKIWAEDAETILRWFESRGTRMPVIPEVSGGYGLVGARYCPFPDLTRAAHVYYSREDKKTLSLFVVGRTLSGEDPPAVGSRGHVVRIARLGAVTVGVVGDEKDDVEAFIGTFHTTIARR